MKGKLSCLTEEAYSLSSLIVIRHSDEEETLLLCKLGRMQNNIVYCLMMFI
jgi:hypothetical protein